MATDNPFEDTEEDEENETPPVDEGETEEDTPPVGSKPKAAPKTAAAPKTRKLRQPRATASALPEDLDQARLPLSAVVGDLAGTLKLHNGRAVIALAPVGWVGPEPLVILADDLGQLTGVIDSLVWQATR